MKERLSASFPYVVAAVFPLAGLVFAGARAAEKEMEEARTYLVAAFLGALIWALVLTAF